MSKRSSRKRQKKDSRGFDFVKFIATAAILAELIDNILSIYHHIVD